MGGEEVNSEDRSEENRGEDEVRNAGGSRGAWNHPIIVMTHDQIQRRDQLKSTILSESSLRAYSSLLSRFVCYVASRDPTLLTDDLWSELQIRSPDKWKSFVRSYYLTKPRPPSSMVNLSEITPIFIDWECTMKKRKKNESSTAAPAATAAAASEVPAAVVAAAEAVANGGAASAAPESVCDVVSDMSPSTYNSCRSAVVSLFTLFEQSSDNFDFNASRIIRALNTVRSSTAQQGAIRPQKGKLPLSFEDYCKTAKSM